MHIINIYGMILVICLPLWETKQSGRKEMLRENIRMGPMLVQRTGSFLSSRTAVLLIKPFGYSSFLNPLVGEKE